MSARVSRGALPRGTLRNVQRRKMVFDVDLNAPLPETEIFNDEGTSSHLPSSQQVEGGQAPASSQHVEGGQNLALGQRQQGFPPPPVPIDVDSIDDDVIVSSPRAFAGIHHQEIQFSKAAA
ncbi:hypothetical protein Ancab_013715 [Ancistrocladus abbreviatus]